MVMFRKFLVFVAASSLTFLLYTTAFNTAAIVAFTPAHLKTWLRQSHVYDTIVDNILSQSKGSLAKSSGGDQSVADQPAVKEAAKKAFNPQFLQNTSEQFIDGVTPWLEGKSPQPTFAIDIAGAKKAFAQNIADYARTRYAGLPVCPKGQVPNTSDILSVDCRVPGIAIDAQIQQTTNDLTNSKDFLPDATFTASNLTTGQGTDKKPLFDQLKNVPKGYSWAHRTPYILGGLALLAIGVIVLASTERRKGVRRVATSLTIAGGGLLISLWLVGFGERKLETHIIQTPSASSGLQSTGLALLKEVQHSLSSTLVVFITVFLAVAVSLAIYLFITRSKEPKERADESTKDSDSSTKPKTPPEKPPAKLVQ